MSKTGEQGLMAVLIVVIAAFLFGFIACPAYAVDVVTISGETLLSDLVEEGLSDNTWVQLEGDATLTLDDSATIYQLSLNPFTLTVRGEGNSTLTVSNGVSAGNGHLIIEGGSLSILGSTNACGFEGQSLTMNGGSLCITLDDSQTLYGMRLSGSAVINGGSMTINVNSSEKDAYGLFIGDSFTMNSGNVEVSAHSEKRSSYGIHTNGLEIAGGSTCITTLTGWIYDSTYGSVGVAGSSSGNKGWTISGGELTVASTSVDGTVRSALLPSRSGARHYLTLSGGSITATGGITNGGTAMFQEETIECGGSVEVVASGIAGTNIIITDNAVVNATINADVRLSISGGAYVEARSPSGFGIRCGSTLKGGMEIADNAHVVAASGNRNAIYSQYGMSITGAATVEAYGGGWSEINQCAIRCEQEIVLGNGLGITTPEGGVVYDEGNGFVIRDTRLGYRAQDVVIQPVDTTELEAAIVVAQELLTLADENPKDLPDGAKYITAEERVTLEEATGRAQALLDTHSYSEALIAATLEVLHDATIEPHVVMVDNAELQTAIDNAEAFLAAVIIEPEDGTSSLEAGTEYLPRTTANEILAAINDAVVLRDSSLRTQNQVDATSAMLDNLVEGAEMAIVNWTRLPGSDRFATAALICQEAFPEGSTCEYAVVAYGWKFPDALAASSLAGCYGCPVLLTDGKTLSPACRDELERLGVSHVLLMGSADSVTEAAADEMRALGIEVERVAGADRQGTSLDAMSRVMAMYPGTDTVVVTDGTNYPDALSMGPWCYEFHAPMLLCGWDHKLTQAQLDAIEACGISNVIVLGGPGSVSYDVEEQLASIGLGPGQVSRFAGSDRFDTGRMVAEWAMDEYGMGVASVVATNGWNYPDALAASALCGQTNSVMVLVGTNRASWANCADRVLSGGRERQVARGYVLGDEKSVNKATYDHLVALAE